MSMNLSSPGVLRLVGQKRNAGATEARVEGGRRREVEDVLIGPNNKP